MQMVAKPDSHAMTLSLPKFYKNLVAVDRSKHMGSGLREDFGLGFAASINAVPVNLVEMTQLSHFYPLGFTTDEDPVPVAIVGLREGENLFIDDHGEWLEGAFIPGYIRRYPFLFRSEHGS
jgi:hypothetical protein